MLNDFIRYIRKDIEEILIPSEKDCNRFNPRYWKIVTNMSNLDIIGSVSRSELIISCLRYKRIKKTFFSFVFVGDKFPIISKHKQIYPLLKKYKFAKVYMYHPTLNCLECLYFKRGVIFYKYLDRELRDNKDVALLRLIKLLKLKRN